jgi:Flp pilus assembly protein TadD
MATIAEVEQIFQRAFTLRCEGDYGAAKSELNRVLSLDASHIKARHQLGLIQGFEGDFEGSVATLQSLCSQFPNNVEVRFDLGMAQAMIGDYDSACANFRECVRLDPNHDRAQDQLAYC